MEFPPVVFLEADALCSARPGIQILPLWKNAGLMEQEFSETGMIHGVQKRMRVVSAKIDFAGKSC
jgi:hypothetical protein